MKNARWQHTETLLPSGLVLVTGGFGDVGVRSDAELYEPLAAQWTTVQLTSARAKHTATLLKDGKVLLVGGVNGDGPLALTELFDPGSKTFAPTTPLPEARAGHFASLLPDGRVIVAGGADGAGPLTSVEIYDPVLSTWQLARALTTPRNEPTGTSFPDGTVLVAGGVGVAGIPLATAERFKRFDNGTLCDRATDCQSGYCADGVCCNTACTGTCDSCAVHLDASGTPRGAAIPGTCAPVDDCGRYACFGTSRSCKETCDSVNDCAPGAVCDPTHACVDPPPERQTLDTSGCVLAPPGSARPSPWPPAALSLLAVAALGARRRGARTPRPGAPAVRSRSAARGRTA